MPFVYRQAALERGFSQGATRLSQPKFESAFVAFYGESFLARFGCEVQLGKDSNWLRTVFRARSHLRAFHPLQHALVQIFLESTLVVSSKKIPFGRGPWKCPNPYAAHDEQFPIKRASKISILPSGEFVASARCSCGFGFTFSRIDDSDPNLPIVRRTRGFGSAWEVEAARLRRAGLSTSAIAKKMHITFKTVERILRKRPLANQIRPSQLKEEWRREWLKLLDQVPGRRRTLAREMNGSLYKRLRRWDKVWLLAQSEFGNARYTPINRVDWVTRDKEWSEVLRVAAQKVKASGLPRRVGAATIVHASGLPKATVARLDRLPICRAVLNEFSESSFDDARERRLRAAVDKAREKGWPRKDWALRYLAGLSKKELSPRLNVVLQALVSDPGN